MDPKIRSHVRETIQEIRQTHRRDRGVLMRPTSSVKGKWTYLYRAVDKQGQTVDFLLSEQRDTAAAKRFFIKAIRNNESPAKITRGRL